MNAAAAALLVAILAGLFWLGLRAKPPASTPDAPPAPTVTAGQRMAGATVALLEAIAAALLVVGIADWLGYSLRPGIVSAWGIWALVGWRRPDWILDPIARAYRLLRPTR